MKIKLPFFILLMGVISTVGIKAMEGAGLFKSFLPEETEKTEEELSLEKEFFYEDIEPDPFEEPEEGDVLVRRLSNEEILGELKNEIKRLVQEQRDILNQITDITKKENEIGNQNIQFQQELIALIQKDPEENKQLITTLQYKLDDNRKTSNTLNSQLAQLNSQITSIQNRINLIHKTIESLDS